MKFISQDTKVNKFLRDYPPEKYILEDKEFKFTEGRLVAGKNSNNPALAIKKTGSVCFCWSEMKEDRSGDCIKVALYDNQKLFGPIDVSTKVGIEFQPSIVVDERDRIWIAWSAFRDGKWSILLRCFDGSTGGEEIQVIENDEGIFNPTLLFTKSGELYVAWEQVKESYTRIGISCINNCNQFSITEPIIINKNGAHSFRPTLMETNDNSVWLAYDSFDGSYDIYLQQLNSKTKAPIRVTEDNFQNYQPALAADSDGCLWIAWASNKNDKGDPWYLTRWLYLKRWDGNRFSDPFGPQRDRDINRIDFFQGWEFPSIVVDKEGRVWLFGQSSHTLYAQYYANNEWSEIINFSERKWGSWKPRCRAIISSDGVIYLVSMGLNGLQFHIVEPTSRPYRRADTIQESISLPIDSNKQSHRKGKNKKEDFQIIDKEGKEYQVFFGDIHAHSVYSDGVGDVDEFYLRAIHGFFDDFAALADHDFLDGIELNPSTYKWMCNLATRFNKPGKFTTFSAWEWTPPAIPVHAVSGQQIGEGHKHIIFASDKGPLFSYGDPNSNNGGKLLRLLKECRAIAIPHHIGWSGCNWDSHDSEIQRLVEICSTHGRYEYEGNLPIGYRQDQIKTDNFIVDVLKKGFYLGFTGGSDSHGLLWHGTFPSEGYGASNSGLKVGWKENSLRTGLTAILSPELSRETLFEALFNRRCYATSGAKIFIDFQINGYLMGSKFVTNNLPQIKIRVKGTSGLQSVEVIRDGFIMCSLQTDRKHSIKEIGCTVEDEMISPGSNHFYYLRVIQEDGEMAWSSPIWVGFQAQ